MKDVAQSTKKYRLEGQKIESALVNALEKGYAKRAALLILHLDCLAKNTREILAEMLAGDPVKHPWLRRVHKHRLRFVPWGVKGRPVKTVEDDMRDMDTADQVFRKEGQWQQGKKVSRQQAVRQVADNAQSEKSVANAARKFDKKLMRFKMAKTKSDPK